MDEPNTITVNLCPDCGMPPMFFEYADGHTDCECLAISCDSYDVEHVVSWQKALAKWNEKTAKAYAERSERPIGDNGEHEPASAKNEPQNGSERKTKKQLRAEAVERLDDCRYTTTGDLAYAMVGWGHGPHTGEELRYALIDLLTDDGQTCKPTCKPKQAVDKQADRHSSVTQNLSDVTENVSDETAGNADTREQLEMDADGTGNGTCPNGDGTPSNDTREQLEADIAASSYSFVHTPAGFRDIKSWLDRQDAITRREVLCQPDERDEQIAELTAELDACKLREEAARDYDFREAAERWEQAYEDKCAEVVRLTEERDQFLDERDCMAGRVLDLNAECDKLREKNSRQRKQLSELQDAIHERNEGELKRQWKQQVEELKAENKRLRVEWESERDYADQCEARAKELTAERDELKAFANRLETAAHDKLGVTLFNVDYVTEEFMLHVRDTLTAEREQLRDAIEAGQFYAMYCDAYEERDRLKDVVQKQADSFAKLERELHEAKVEAMHNRDGVDALKEKCHAQREELARFNAEKRGKRRLPKHVAWPRHDDGKLVELNGADASSVAFTRDSCLVRYFDGSDEFFGMKELRRRWKEPR